MSREKQYVIVVAILVIVGSIGYRLLPKNNKEINVEVREIEKEEISERKNKKIDINEADYEILRDAGLRKRVAEEIVYFQEEWGNIPKIDLLVSRKGIGEKSIEEIKKKFYVKQKDKKLLKKVGVNSSHLVMLKYIGLNDSDIKKIKSWKKKNGNIFSNTDLMEILTKKKYEKVKDKVMYD